MWSVSYFEHAAGRAVVLSVALVAGVFGNAGTAQASEPPAGTQVDRVSFPLTPRADRSAVHPGSIRRSLERLDYSALVLDQTPSGSSTRRSSVGRKILGGAIGGVGGFFAGGYLGAKIEGTDCGCDDPGLKGVLIGAPIGAVVGAILGAKFF